METHPTTMLGNSGARNWQGDWWEGEWGSGAWNWEGDWWEGACQSGACDWQGAGGQITVGQPAVAAAVGQPGHHQQHAALEPAVAANVGQPLPPIEKEPEAHELQPDEAGQDAREDEHEPQPNEAGQDARQEAIIDVYEGSEPPNSSVADVDALLARAAKDMHCASVLYRAVMPSLPAREKNSSAAVEAIIDVYEDRGPLDGCEPSDDDIPCDWYECPRCGEEYPMKWGQCNSCKLPIKATEELRILALLRDHG